MSYTAHSEVVVAVIVGFAEDRMMDILTGRAPPPARAESHRPKGSRELARPGPSLSVRSPRAETAPLLTAVIASRD